jgi:DNA-binding transcriptional LysR family regulator
MQNPDPSQRAVKTTRRNAAWTGSWATLRDLEVFLAVIETRKTTAAAHRLGVSQPAVSRTLSSFEEKSGRQLFRHEGTGLVPTADALDLYEQIRPIFDSLENLKNFEWNQAKPTVLRLACPPTMAQCWVEDITAKFLTQNPDVHVSMDIVSTPEVLALVADHRADLGVADVNPGNTGLNRSAFRRSQMVCVIPNNHALAQRERIDVAALDGQRLVMLAKRNPMRPTLEQLLTKHGSEPEVVMETATALSALNFVSRGVGIALINPFPALLSNPVGVSVRSFQPSLPYEASFFTSSQITATSVVHRYMEFARRNQPANEPYSTAIQ